MKVGWAGCKTGDGPLRLACFFLCRAFSMSPTKQEENDLRVDFSQSLVTKFCVKFTALTKLDK